MENIPEYLSICTTTATVNDNVYTWTIPYSYYSNNNRGAVCYVSLSDCNIYADYEGGIIIKYENSTQNMICSVNSSGSYLGNMQLILGASKNNYHMYNNNEPVKLLTQAHPITISISTWTIDGVAQPIDEGLFILKFEYFNQDKSIQNYQNTFYKTLN